MTSEVANDGALRIFADPIVALLSATVGVKSILCFGSWAIGTNDEYSDVDLYVVCDPEVVPFPERRAGLLKVPGISGLKENEPDHWDNQWCPYGEKFLVSGTRFDVHYNTAEWIKIVVTKTARNGEVSFPELRFRPYSVLGLLEHSRILHDPDSFLKDIKASLYPFPKRLKSALIDQNQTMCQESLNEMRDYTKRGIGNTSYLFHLARVTDSMGELLFAINGRYSPATKRVEELLKRLAILPKDFLDRYTKALELPCDEAHRRKQVDALQAIKDEIDELAENGA